MKKWYDEEYEFQVEVTGFLRGDHTERYCRNGEEVGDRYTCTYGCPVNQDGQGICCLLYTSGGAILWNANPFLTALVCLGKGILAGLAAGLVYRAIAWGGKSHSSGRMLGGSIAAGIVSPVVNTGLFLLGLFFLFPTYLEAWATGRCV